jgi:hypothetical protein
MNVIEAIRRSSIVYYSEPFSHTSPTGIVKYFSPGRFAASFILSLLYGMDRTALFSDEWQPLEEVSINEQH